MSVTSNTTESSSGVIIKKNSKDNVEESLEEKKERLKKEINELKVLCSDLEYGIGITKFGHDDNIKPVNECLKYLNKLENNVHGTQDNLQYILYSYAGLHCAKFTDNCVVFKFASFGENQECDKYAVQIMIEDDKVKLGNWIMPMWLDMDQVLLETPLQDPRNMMCFLRNCKHHIYCYHCRMSEFNNLKSLTSEMTNCHIWTNLNYTQINIELFGMHEMESSTYLDLVLYLEYHSCEIKPYLIVIDSLGTRKFPEKRIKALTSYFKYFKHMNLEEAFKSLIDGSATSYIWVPKIDNDSALDLNDTSDTESETYNSIRSSSKRNREHMQLRKRKQYEKQKSVLDKITVEDNPVLTLENKRKKTEKISGTPSSANKLITSRNVKSKFKQTQLNFEMSKTKKQIAVSDETENDTEIERRSIARSSASTKKLPVLTSTPARGKSKEPASFETFSNWNISDIESNLIPTKSETILTRKKIKSGNLSKGLLKKNSALKKDKEKAHTDMRETIPIKSRIPILIKAPGRINKNRKMPGLREGVLKDRAKNKNARAERKI